MLAMAGGLGVSTAARAAVEPSSKTTWGTVTGLETAGPHRSITVQTASGPRTLAIPDGPPVVFDSQGRSAGLDALRTGDWVRVGFEATAAGSTQERDWATQIQQLSGAPVPSR